MDEEISIEVDGELYSAEYAVDNDELTVYLPDGSIRSTWLRGLKPKMSAMVHLKSYAKRFQDNSQK